MDPRLDTGGWLTLTETHYWISTDRDFHPARCAELSSARERGAQPPGDENQGLPQN